MNKVQSIQSIVSADNDAAGVAHISEVMEQYQSHKVVRAAVIKSIPGYYVKGSDLGMVIGLAGEEVDIPYIASADMVSRYEPKVGDYVVLYDNDYVSISPKKQFEDGYTKTEFENVGDDDDEIYLPTSEIEQIEHIARFSHAVVMGFSRAYNISKKSWDELTDKEKQSYIGRVAHFLLYPDAQVSAPHEAWKLRMQLNGWKYGASFSTTLLTHPDILPFNSLSAEQQAGDYIIKSIVQETFHQT